MRKKLPPYAKQMKIPVDNDGVFIHVGWISWERANAITQQRGFIYPPNTDPTLYLWPVRGTSVIVMDWHGLSEDEYQALEADLMAGGATKVDHLSMIGGESWKGNVSA